MNYIIELFYNVIESLLFTGFIAAYFEVKQKYSKKVTITISFSLIFGMITLMTILDPSWVITLSIFILYLVCILEFFYKGTLLEHLLISIIASSLLAFIDVCVLTLFSKILGVEYRELVTQSSISRFLVVLITKSVYLIFVSIIVSFKRKYAIMLHRVELFMISSTLSVSCILISIVRNIIYNTKEHYNAFFIILLCVLLLNIGQYYTMIYISMKNLKEKSISLMQKQIEMQEDSIRNLEVKYDETEKIRHDMKSHISCALKLAEQGDIKELINYLNEISEDKINKIVSHVKTERRILGAVINSKLGMAESKGFDMKCVILNEMDNIKDIDAGVLLANLLDNAIEACEKNYGHSEIMLKIWSNAGYYCIEISNTVERDVLAENPNLFTSKSNKELHGIGLKSVKDVVEKYNGMMNFKQKANTFYAYVSLEK